MIGRVVGSYEILERVGEGGMGTVYRAVDRMLDREVALKAIRPDLMAQPQILERFRSEARALARLSHPNVATIYSFFREGEEHFLAMEFVRGRTLGERLRAGGPLPLAEAVPIFLAALAGVEHAHAAGILHRDLKPDNLMLTESGGVKVMDFGLARAAGSGRLTTYGVLVGTLRYMSPEQVRGEDADRRSDVYALGVVLFEMLTGGQPFAGSSDYEILRRKCEEEPKAPRALAPHLPEWVDAVVLRALARDPEARYPSVAEFAATLSERLASAAPTRVLPATQQTLVLPPPETQAAAAPSARRGAAAAPSARRSVPLWPVAAAALLVLALGGAAWWAFAASRSAGAAAVSPTQPAAPSASAPLPPAPDDGPEAATTTDLPIGQLRAQQPPGAGALVPAPPPQAAARQEPSSAAAAPQAPPLATAEEPGLSESVPSPVPPDPSPSEVDESAEPSRAPRPEGLRELERQAADLYAMYDRYLESDRPEPADEDLEEELLEEMELFEDGVAELRQAVAAAQQQGGLRRLRGRLPGTRDARTRLRNKACAAARPARRIEALMPQVAAPADVRQKWQGIRAHLGPLSELCPAGS